LSLSKGRRRLDPATLAMTADNSANPAERSRRGGYRLGAGRKPSAATQAKRAAASAAATPSADTKQADASTVMPFAVAFCIALHIIDTFRLSGKGA
jgi:hypothetical protein